LSFYKYFIINDLKNIKKTQTFYISVCRYYALMSGRSQREQRKFDPLLSLTSLLGQRHKGKLRECWHEWQLNRPAEEGENSSDEEE
jgi:hypothetical protein